MRYMTGFQTFLVRRWLMPNPFDAVMFVLLVAGALNELGWLPW